MTTAMANNRFLSTLGMNGPRVVIWNPARNGAGHIWKLRSVRLTHRIENGWELQKHYSDGVWKSYDRCDAQHPIPNWHGYSELEQAGFDGGMCTTGCGPGRRGGTESVDHRQRVHACEP